MCVSICVCVSVRLTLSTYREIHLLLPFQTHIENAGKLYEDYYTITVTQRGIHTHRECAVAEKGLLQLYSYSPLAPAL